MKNRLEQWRVEKAREFFIAPWNEQNAFVILWGYGDGSNVEQNNSKGEQNKIRFTNTEKCQIDAIAKILDMEDRIYPYQPKNNIQKKIYHLTWSDQLLSDYLSNIGFNIRKSYVGAHFPSDFPNELMDIGAYGFWLSNGGITRKDRINPRITFSASREFLIDFQRELETHVGFPGDVGKLNLNGKTSPNVVDLYSLIYRGKNSFRILSAMFKRTANICYSVKRDKTIRLVSNYANITLDQRDKAKKPQQPHRVKTIIALYDALDLMDIETKERYITHCGDWIDEIRDRAAENWYLERGDVFKMEIRELI